MKKIIFSLTFVFIGLTLQSCRDKKEAIELIQEMTKLRPAVMQASAEVQKTFTWEQHQILKKYFSSVQVLSAQIKENKIEIQATNVRYLCENVLLDSSYWQAILSTCTIQGYFACSESVRMYKEALLRLYEKALPDAKRSFQEHTQCNWIL